MKKTSLWILGALLFAACSQIEIELIEPEQPEVPTVTLTATLENEATKTYLDGSNYVCWADGDQVWINGATYAVKVSDDKVTIAGVTAAENYACVYPASAVSSYDGAKIKFTLPQTQTITYNSAGKQVLTLPMAAYGNGESALEFKNLCGLLAIKVSNTDKDSGLKPTNIKISTSDAPDWTASLYGTTSAARDLSDGSNIDSSENGWAILASNIGNSGDRTELNVEINGSPIIAKGSSATYYVTVPVIDNGTQSKLSVEMSGTLGSNSFILEKKTTASTKVIGRNQLGTIPISSSLFYEIKTSGTDWNGSGTEADPWQISCPDHWNKMAQMVLEGQVTSSHYFRQVCDIDFGGASMTQAGIRGYVPPGSSFSVSTLYELAFPGVYDGGGHTISNCVFTLPSYSYVTDDDDFYHTNFAPFPYVTGTVKNLSMNYSRSFSYSAPTSSTTILALGGIVSFADGNAVLSNLNFSGTLTATGSRSANYLAGVVAEVGSDVDMSNLNFAGTLKDQCTYVSKMGGVIALSKADALKDCHALSGSRIEFNTFGGGCHVGGVVGCIESAVSVSDCSSAVTIASTSTDADYSSGYIGGLVGKFVNFPYRKVTNMQNAGTSISIKSEATASTAMYSTYVGGFYGYVEGDFGLDMEECHNYAAIDVRMPYFVYAGGIAGAIDRTSDYPENLPALRNENNITARSNSRDCYAGGVAGEIKDGGFCFKTFSNNGSICAIADDDAYAGGLVGYADFSNTADVTMNDITNSGDVTAKSLSDWSYAGGLFGLLDHGHANITFEKCTNNNPVYAEANSSTACAGGLVGYVPGDGYLTRINKFRNYGSVTAVNSENSYAGGVVGYDHDGTYNATVQIFNSENRGAVRSASDDDAAGGGFFGMHDSDGGTYDPCVINCCNRADISVSGSEGDVYIGGIIGYCYNDCTEIGCSYSRCNLASLAYTDGNLYCGGLIGYDDYTDTGSQWTLLTTITGCLYPHYSIYDGGREATTLSGSDLVIALQNAISSVPAREDITNLPGFVSWRVDSDGYPALSNF